MGYGWLGQLLLFAGLAAMVAMPAPPVYAQQDADDDAVVEEIVVTGSRIRREEIDATRPIISVGQETLQNLAFTNIADALNQIPAFGAGLTPEGGQNAFTAGSNFLDLFDLGTQRTLTLVDGKRFVSSNPPSLFGSASGLQVDFNAIPIALVENIEVAPMAGAAIYGSDAIAGTVNVFLRDDYEGFEVSGQYGHTSEGDGDIYQTQIVFGFNFDDGRGNMAMSLENNRQLGLGEVDRDWLVNGELAYEEGGTMDLDGDGMDDDIDGDGVEENFRTILQDGIVQVVGGHGGGVTPVAPNFRGSTLFAPAHGLGRLEDRNFYQFQDGDLIECHGAADLGTVVRVYDSSPDACGVHNFFQQSSQIRSPLERTVLTNFLTYDINDYVTYKQSIIVSRSEAAELANQGGFQTGFFQGESGPLTVSTSHPFISEQARGILTANNLTEFKLHRYNNDLVADGRDEINSNVSRADFTLQGEFEWNDREFYWDVSAVFGRSDIETSGTGIIDGRFFNAVDAVRLDDAALDPILGALTHRQSERVRIMAANDALPEDADPDPVPASGDLNGDGMVDRADALLQVANNGGSGIDVVRAADPVVCQVNLLTAQQGLEDASGNPLQGPGGHNAPASGGGLTDQNRPFSDGCVPLNLFGYGASSPESLAWVTGGPQFTSTDLRQEVFMANLGGEILDLPAGPLAFSVGWENRTDKGDFRTGLDSAVPFTRSSAIAPSGGELEADEWYVEFLFPIVSADMGYRFLREAEVNFATRRTETTLTGGGANEEDTTEWRILAQPFEWLTLRASTANAIRTPSVVELFTPGSQTFVLGDDPCDRRTITQGDAPATRRANCIAHMAALNVNYDPATFASSIQDGTISGGFSSGNPDLAPELSDSWSMGFVLEPLPELTVAFDWFNIELEDRISNFGWEALAAACYDDPGYPNEFCGRFDRDEGTGQISAVRSTWLNSAESRWVGSQLQASYDLDLFDTFGWNAGLVEFFLSTLYVRTDEFQNTMTSPVTDTSGGYAIPDWQGTFDTTWTYNDFRFFWRILFQDEPKLDPNGDLFYLNRAGNKVITKTRHPILHNMSVTYNITDNALLQLTVNNVLDRQPNSIEDAIGFFGANEELGRRFALQARVSF